MSLVDIKIRTRRALHQRHAVPCMYSDLDRPDGLPLPEDATVGLTVRWHNKLARNGDLDGDYAEVIEGIERLIFSDENVAEVSAALVEAGEDEFVLARGGEITIPGYKGMIFVLDSEEPPDGPIETVWVVARKRD